MWKLIIIISFCLTVYGDQYVCNENKAAIALKTPIYKFSINILQRVTEETEGHFVFSPLSTWLQLTSLAEGAKGVTRKEIWKVTRYHRNKCIRRKVRRLLNIMEQEFKVESRWRSVILVNNLLNMKKSFINEVERSNNIHVSSVNFNNPDKSAAEANNLIHTMTNGEICDVFYRDDFIYATLIMADTAYFKSAWKFPFNPVYTSIETFYHETGDPAGEVNMMTKNGYFNITEIPKHNIKVLDLPCGEDNRISMLLFLPTNTEESIRELYYSLKDIRLATIFNLFKKKGNILTRVKIPRFNVTTDLDNLPELVNDMGVRRMFYPHLANFKGISDYKIHVSLMTHVAQIEVTEKGVTGSQIAKHLIVNRPSEEFVANKPFGFMLVDWKRKIIVFAGIYSKPSIY